MATEQVSGPPACHTVRVEIPLPSACAWWPLNLVVQQDTDHACAHAHEPAPATHAAAHAVKPAAAANSQEASDQALCSGDHSVRTCPSILRSAPVVLRKFRDTVGQDKNQPATHVRRQRKLCITLTLPHSSSRRCPSTQKPLLHTHAVLEWQAHTAGSSTDSRFIWSFALS